MTHGERTELLIEYGDLKTAIANIKSTKEYRQPARGKAAHARAEAIKARVQGLEERQTEIELTLEEKFRWTTLWEVIDYVDSATELGADARPVWAHFLNADVEYERATVDGFLRHRLSVNGEWSPWLPTHANIVHRQHVAHLEMTVDSPNPVLKVGVIVDFDTGKIVTRIEENT